MKRPYWIAEGWAMTMVKIAVGTYFLIAFIGMCSEVAA